MKRILLFSTVLFLISSQSLSQNYNWGWAKGSGGINTDKINGIAADLVGNVYVTGMFQSPQLSFDGITIYNSADSLGTGDLFLIKYDPSGHALWAKKCGGLNNDYGSSVTIDQLGNIYLTGTFSSDSIFFGDSILVNTLPGLPEMMAIKYDASGNEIWAFNAKGISFSEGVGIGVDATGNGYITGQYSGNLLISNSSSNSLGFFDVFLLKFTYSGKVLWVKSFGNNGDDFPYSLCLDKWNNIFITGSYNSGTLNFDNYALNNAGDYDVFIAKIDTLGNTIWALSEGDLGEDAGKGIAADINGNVYVTGAFASQFISFGLNVFTNAGGFDLFVVKYNPSGQVQWSKQSGGSGYFDWGYGLQCDQSGLFVCGLFSSDTISFDNTTLINSGNWGTTDVFLVKYDFAGNVIFAGNAIGNKAEEAACIATDNTNNCYLAGGFESNVLLFGGNSLTNSSIAGNGDLFLAKLELSSVGFSSINKPNNLNIFPNPASDFFILSNDGINYGKKYTVTIYDINGHLLYNQSLINNSANSFVNCENWVAGSYLVSIQCDDTVYKGQLIKK